MNLTFHLSRILLILDNLKINYGHIFLIQKIDRDNPHDYAY